jgi:hypothetical protein
VLALEFRVARVRDDHRGSRNGHISVLPTECFLIRFHCRCPLSESSYRLLSSPVSLPFLPLIFLGHCFGLIPASCSFAASAFPVPPLTVFGFPPIKRPLALEAEATRLWVAPRKWGKKKEKIQSWLTLTQ